MSDAAWTRQEHMIASLIDLMGWSIWVTSNRGVKKSQRSPEPKPVERPADLRHAAAKALVMIQQAKAYKRFQRRLAQGVIRWPSKSVKRTSL